MNAVVFFAEISDAANPQSQYFITLVSAEKRHRLNKYHFPIDRNLSLYAEILVCRKATELLGFNNHEIIFETNVHGKPYLIDYPKSLIFHTLEMLLRSLLLTTISV